MKNEHIQLLQRIDELEKEVQTLKNQQIEISRAKELYLKIFEDFPALIWRSRLDKLCDYFNKTWLEFTGRTMEQEFGNGWAEGVHPDDFDFCVQTYVKCFDKREAFLMEYRMKNKFGEYRWIRDFGRPFYDLDGTFLGYIGSCYDITPIKDTEKQLIDLNTTKDKFFAIIGHDLRNPFSQILGFSEFLYENHSNLDRERIKMVAGQIFLSSLSTFHLLENLLEWSRSQSNAIIFTPKKTNIYNAIQTVLESIVPGAEQKCISLSCIVDRELEIFADQNILKTILRNLICNAIKFTPTNGKVEVSVEKMPEYTLFSISDTGVGMDESQKASIFGLGDKTSKAGTAGEKGTGLGLVLCKEFVERHGGKIWVESTLGSGSNFKFTIPSDASGWAT